MPRSSAALWKCLGARRAAACESTPTHLLASASLCCTSFSCSFNCSCSCSADASCSFKSSTCTTSSEDNCSDREHAMLVHYLFNCKLLCCVHQFSIPGLLVQQQCRNTPSISCCHWHGRLGMTCSSLRWQCCHLRPHLSFCPYAPCLLLLQPCQSCLSCCQLLCSPCLSCLGLFQAFVSFTQLLLKGARCFGGLFSCGSCTAAYKVSATLDDRVGP